jgi:hypothetical protein
VLIQIALVSYATREDAAADSSVANMSQKILNQYLGLLLFFYLFKGGIVQNKKERKQDD